jgi:hypothetical protein
VIKGVATYYQVHEIINEETNDRKGFSMKREKHVITSLVVLTWTW